MKDRNVLMQMYLYHKESTQTFWQLLRGRSVA